MSAKHYAENRDAILERMRARYRALTPEQRRARRNPAAIKAYDDANSERKAIKRLGLDPASVRPRPQVCDVCGGPPSARSLHLDHCHAGGEFRGWLCHGCNTALGGAKDSAKILRLLADYLERA